MLSFRGMKTKMDAKSAMAGLIVGIALETTVAAVENSSEPVGCYQTAAAAGFVVILDTQTGKAWGANLAAPQPGFQTVHDGFWEKKSEK